MEPYDVVQREEAGGLGGGEGANERRGWGERVFASVDREGWLFGHCRLLETGQVQKW